MLRALCPRVPDLRPARRLSLPPHALPVRLLEPRLLEQNGEVKAQFRNTTLFRPRNDFSYFSWKCFRLQFLDSAAVTKSLPALTTETATARTGPVTKTTDWFGEADDWGEEADTFDVVKSPVTAMEEENGNFVLLDNGKNFNQNLNLARLTLDDDDKDHRSHAASAASPSPTSEASEPSSSCSSAATPDPTANANAVAAASARVTGESATAEIEDDQGHSRQSM